MRKIKFRAWLNYEEHMIDWENLHLETGENGLFIWVGDDLDNNFGSAEGESDFELMQYTGLKDKNGREIYEGDILEITPKNREHYPEKSVFFVVSTQTLWGYDFYWKHVSGYDCSTHITRIDDNYEQLLNVEIIGNIHEHPHLLKEE